MTIDILCLQQLSNAALFVSTRRVVAAERAVTADLLLHLGEIDARRLYLDHAYPSLFAFCVGELGFSEDVAFNRIQVARLARRFPEVVEALRNGRVHLAGLRLLAPVMNDDNHRALLAEASGKSKRDIEELVARLSPKPLAPDAVRKLPPPPATRSPVESPVPLATNGAGKEATTATLDGRSAATIPRISVPALSLPHGPPTPPLVEPGPRARPVIPLDGERYRFQFTGSRALKEKLREAQDLLSHQLPNDDLAALVERALDLLIADVKKKRFAVGCAPRTSPQASSGPAKTRHVPDAIKRAVFERDQGRCTFVDARGRRCAETRGIELDHVEGFARTHRHSVEGIRLRCRAHNAHAADEMYGRRFMERARERGRGRHNEEGGRPGTTSQGSLALGR